MNMLIWAIQVAGLNQAKIRDVLAYRPEPFVGVTGEIPLSAVNDDDGEVYLASSSSAESGTITAGRSWDCPRGRP